MMDAKELNKLWQSYQLRVTDEIAKSSEVLFCNKSVIGTLGNFSASTGKAKSKKTFNVSAILAAALETTKDKIGIAGHEGLAMPIGQRSDEDCCD